MTIWRPEIRRRAGPLYRRIAEALGEDVAAGRLTPGSRLPTQRDLAERLGVTVTTVTRAYAEAERRGLISGEVGRGTFVRALPSAWAGEWSPERGAGERAAIDLSLNSLYPYAHADELGERMTAASRAVRKGLLDYQPHRGAPEHRAAGARWLSRRGIEAAPERLLVTAGAQHAMTVVFAALVRPGDLVLVEETTYPGIKSLAHYLHFRLQGVAMDQEGMRPDALEAACRSGAAKALYVMPTVQNPRSSVMSEARRRKIAAVAAAHDLPVVEDDTYGFLVAGARPLAAKEGARTFYLTSLSKSIAPALRIGYLLAPQGMVEPLASALFATVIFASPLTAQLASEWIADGTAERVAEWKRQEITARQELAGRVLGGLPFETTPASPHLWLGLPAAWKADRFAAEARMRGVLLTPAEDFAVSPEAAARPAVRICLGPPRDRAVLSQGLKIVRELVSQPPPPHRPVL